VSRSITIGKLIVTTFAESKPGSTSVSRWKLRISRPAPASSTNASATCDTTSELRRNTRRRLPALPRPPSFRLSTGSRREFCSAGTSPNSTPVSSVSAARNTVTRRSTPTSACAGRKNGGSSARMPRNIKRPSSSPSAPPISDSSRLSTSSWRISTKRLAPSAVRTASSRERSVPRASSRLARFAQPISSTTPTADINTCSESFNCGPTTRSIQRSTVAPQPFLMSGYCSAMRPAIALISDCARSRLTPGFSRAIALM
jgi:hypothetical protein